MAQRRHKGHGIPMSMGHLGFEPLAKPFCDGSHRQAGFKDDEMSTAE
jgi:hypothetical protein